MSTAVEVPAPRVADPGALSPESFGAMLELEKTFHSSALDMTLLELVKLRASQINGCTFCIHLHVGRLMARGESALRLHHLAGWRESPLFTPRERAALIWCESLTRLSDTGAPDADYEALSSQFTPAEQVSLTLAIGAINVWNRFNVGFRSPPMMATAA